MKTTNDSISDSNGNNDKGALRYNYRLEKMETVYSYKGAQNKRGIMFIDQKDNNMIEQSRKSWK